jgi:FkbM family methyltransferase
MGKKRRGLQRTVRGLAHGLLPARLLKYQIALQSLQRGEPEIRLLPDLVPAGRTAVDVGAFFGAYTFFLARLASHVHAFEPQPYCVDFLQRAYPAGVTVHPCALGGASGSTTFHLPAGEDAFSQAGRLGESPATALGRHYPVTVEPLDAFDLGDVGFIKIDAEGAEEQILAGAEGLLQRCRPVLLMEIEERHTSRPLDEIFAGIQARGYAGSFLHAGAIRPLAEFSVAEMQRARLAGDRSKPYINNFIFEPES